MWPTLLSGLLCRLALPLSPALAGRDGLVQERGQETVSSSLQATGGRGKAG